MKLWVELTSRMLTIINNTQFLRSVASWVGGVKVRIVTSLVNPVKWYTGVFFVFQRKLESAEKDLHQYESVRRLGLFDHEDSSSETDSIAHLGISRRHSLGGRSDKHADKSRDSTKSKRSSLDQEDLGAKLKTELHRALQVQLRS